VEIMTDNIAIEPISPLIATIRELDPLSAASALGTLIAAMAMCAAVGHHAGAVNPDEP
jgi:hypothetical protein